MNDNILYHHVDNYVFNFKECGNRFNWSTYLKIKKAQSMPENYFCARIPMGFSIGMKLEIVDRMVPSIIRPATVIGVRSYEIKILYDGWPLQYAYWIDDDNTDIHPINWCMKTNHPLDAPAGISLNKFIF